jgi:hypothetical protein
MEHNRLELGMWRQFGAIESSALVTSDPITLRAPKPSPLTNKTAANLNYAAASSLRNEARSKTFLILRIVKNIDCCV